MKIVVIIRSQNPEQKGIAIVSEKDGQDPICIVALLYV